MNNSVRLQLQIWTPHKHYKHYKRYYLKHNTEAILRQGGDRVYEVSRGEEEKGERREREMGRWGREREGTRERVSRKGSERKGGRKGDRVWVEIEGVREIGRRHREELVIKVREWGRGG